MLFPFYLCLRVLKVDTLCRKAPMVVSPALASNIIQTFACAAAIPEIAVLSNRSHGDVAIPASQFSLVPEHSRNFAPPRGGRVRPLLDLPPMSERYLIGLLAVTREKERVFGITTYLSGGHAGIISAIETVFGNIGSFAWGGELHARRGLSGTEILAFNQTSGELWSRQEVERRQSQDHGRTGRGSVQNSLTEVRPSLARRSPVRVPEDARFFPFTRQEQHLHPLLSGYGKNFRHELGAAFMLKTSLIPEYKEDLRDGRTPLDLRGFLPFFTDLEIFARLIEENDMFRPLDGTETVRVFGTLLRFISGRRTPSPFRRRAPGDEDSLGLQLRRYTEKIRSGEALTIEDCDGLLSILDKLFQFFQDRMQDDQGNTYDLYQVS